MIKKNPNATYPLKKKAPVIAIWRGFNLSLFQGRRFRRSGLKNFQRRTVYENIIHHRVRFDVPVRCGLGPCPNAYRQPHSYTITPIWGISGFFHREHPASSQGQEATASQRDAYTPQSIGRKSD
jgi:hypothetical protein